MEKDLYKNLFQRLQVELYKELGYDEASKIIGKVIDEEAKDMGVLNSLNGGINAPVSTTDFKRCCECQNIIDIRGHYGVNGDLYYCADCMNTDY